MTAVGRHTAAAAASASEGPARLMRVASWCGAAAVLVGVVGILGWHLGLEQIIRVAADAVELRYVTALAFVVTGTAIWCAARGRRLLPAFLGILVIAVSAVTVAEYVWGVDLAIDRIGPTSADPPMWPHPGRMAPNTALAFLLAGSALALMSVRRLSRIGWAAVSLAGCVIVALAAVAIAGHACGISVGHAWGVFIPMSIQAAFGFLAVGTGITALAAAGSQAAGRWLPAWMPIAAAIGSLAFTSALWTALTQAEDRAIAARLDADSRLVAAEIAELVRTRHATFGLAIEEWAASPAISQTAWATSAGRYLRNLGDARAVAWIAADGSRTWAVPPGELPAVTLLGPSIPRSGQVISIPSHAGPDLVVAGPLALPNGVPGTAVALIAVDESLRRSLTEIGLADSVVRVFQADREIFGHNPVDASGPPNWTRRAAIDAPPSSLRATVGLTDHAVVCLRSPLPMLVLCGGATMSMLLGLATHLAIRARARERESLAMSHDLAAEIARHDATAETLRRSSTLLAGLFESSPDAVVVDPSGRIVRANERAESLFGWTRAELLTMEVEALVPQRSRAGHAEQRRELLQRPPGLPIGALRDLAALRRDGTEFTVDLNLARLAPGDDSLVIAVVRDVTKRRHDEDVLRGSMAELERRSAELTAQGTALRESEERFRRLVDNVSDGIVVHDREGSIVFANARFLEIFGIPRDELPRMQIEDYVAPASLAALRARREARMRGEEVSSGFEFEGRHRDGTPRWIDMHVVTLRDEHGDIVGTQSVQRDISARRNADIALRESEERFRQAQKMEAVGRLAGGVAHDFNNVLTVIQGYGEMLEWGLPPGDPRRPAVESILSASERASRLTQQLLAFSRKQVIRPESLDLNETVQESVKLLRTLIGEDIDVRTELAAQLGRVHADRGQVDQVVMNLAINARDAMPDGGRLTLRTADFDFDADFVASHPGATAGPYVMLAVEDTGCGMTPEVLARVFEPFFTTKELGKGTGLGLATVYGVAKQSNGYVDVESSPGGGSCFRFYLPRVDSAPPQVRRRQTAPRVTVPTCAETVLLAEDEAAVRELVRSILAEAGYRVIVGATPAEALAAAAVHDGPIHMLLTDVVMPGMGGPEVVRRLRLDRPGARVLYMSGHIGEGLDRQFVLSAESAYLQKPFTAAVLLAKVREVLNGPPSSH